MAKSKSPPPATNSWQSRLRYALDEAHVEGRSQKGMDNSELAIAIGVSNTTVSSWIVGRAESISTNNLIAVCKELNIREEWLLHGTLPMYGNVQSAKRELALSQLFWTILQGSKDDANDKFLHSLGGELLQVFLAKLAAKLSDNDILLIKGMIAAKQYGEDGEAAMEVAIAALEQLSDSDVHQSSDKMDEAA